jgi:hypothetical protein
MAHVTEETPIAFGGASWLKEGLFRLCFEFRYRKRRTIKGDSMTSSRLWTKCSILQHTIRIPQPKLPSFSFHILAVLVRAAVPPITDRWALGGINTTQRSPQRSPILLQQFILQEQTPVLTSLSLHCCSLLPLSIHLFPPSNLERKGSKLWLEARSADFQSLRALGSRLVGVLEFVTLGALLLAG